VDTLTNINPQGKIILQRDTIHNECHGLNAAFSEHETSQLSMYDGGDTPGFQSQKVNDLESLSENR